MISEFEMASDPIIEVVKITSKYLKYTQYLKVASEFEMAWFSRYVFAK